MIEDPALNIAPGWVNINWPLLHGVTNKCNKQNSRVTRNSVQLKDSFNSTSYYVYCYVNKNILLFIVQFNFHGQWHMVTTLYFQLKTIFAMITRAMRKILTVNFYCHNITIIFPCLCLMAFNTLSMEVLWSMEIY